MTKTFPQLPLSPKLRRILLRVVVALALVVVAGVGGAFYVLFYRSMPDYSGQAALRGLAGPVSVLRDAHGVPHIFAASRADALRALGYVHAGERFFQMEMQRRAGQGRLAEVLGADGLVIDKLVRTLGLYRLAQSSLTAMTPETQALFQAYSDGVNVWLDTHRERLSPEFLALRLKPEAWQPADSVVWGKLMALQLSKNLEFDKLRAALAQKFPESQWRGLFTGKLDETVPVTTAPPTVRKAESAFERLGALTGLDHGASNEWVLSGKRTVSGKPLLANDPHLGLEAPILWYLARIVTPEGSVKGATIPGLPLVLLGQNDNIAWGFTNAGSDVQDLFAETLDPKDPTAYLTPKGREKFTVRTETIHVRNAPDVVLTVRGTRHGPVLSDIDAETAALAGKGQVMALAFTGLGDRDLTAESLLRLNRAKNWDEFIVALRLYQAPPQNAVYADREGHIGFISAGLIPVRKGRSDGRLPGDGATGANDWISNVPFTELPQVYDPLGGVIFNANNALVNVNYPYWLGMDWEEPYRARRLQTLLATTEKLTLDKMAAMQADHVSLAARDLMPVLLRVHAATARQTQAQQLLRDWDGAMDRDRPAPLLFDAWLRALNKLAFTDALGNPLAAKGPLKATLISGVLEDKTGTWCAKPTPTTPASCDALILKALDAALDDLTARQGAAMTRWRWGEAHRSMLTNKFYTHVPLLCRRADIVMPSDGDFYTLDRGGSFAMQEPEPFARTHGGGYRGIYDLADPAQSRFMIATGQSGHIFSSHYRDLAEPWNAVKSITLSGGRDELLRQGARELRLLPEP